jgi:hypothetical protein
MKGDLTIVVKELVAENVLQENRNESGQMKVLQNCPCDYLQLLDATYLNDK